MSTIVREAWSRVLDVMHQEMQPMTPEQREEFWEVIIVQVHEWINEEPEDELTPGEKDDLEQLDAEATRQRAADGEWPEYAGPGQ